MIEPVSVGTVTLAVGSATVIGNGTNWLLTVSAFDDLRIGGVSIGIVKEVISDTELTLYTPFSGFVGSAGSGISFQIFPGDEDTVETNRLLRLNIEKFVAGSIFKPDANGNLAGRSAYDDETPPFYYADTSTVPWQVYAKQSSTSGDWSDAQEWSAKGDNGSTGPQGNSGAPNAPVSGYMAGVLGAVDSDAAIDILGTVSCNEVPSLNMITDSAMKGTTFTLDIAAPVFEVPKCISVYGPNSATLSHGGSYKYNNTYGAGGADDLGADIIGLLEKTRGSNIPADLRFGPSFCVTKITADANPTIASYPSPYGLGYLSTVSPLLAFSGGYTFSCFIKVLSGHATININDLNAFYRDGVSVNVTTDNSSFNAADGWVHVVVQHNQKQYRDYHSGYSSFYQPANGEMLFALPKMVMGWREIPMGLTLHDASTVKRLLEG